MRLAVTGATGFIGRYLVRQFVGEGHTCRCWFRPQSDRSGFEAIGDKVEWSPGDLSDFGSHQRLVEGCDAVIHSALYHPAGGFMGGEGDLIPFVSTNIVGTLSLIEAARNAGVPRFIFLSTCAVHDKILDDRPLDETHPLWPKSHYGAHKGAIEKFVHSFGWGHGYDICALRPTGVYGVAHPASSSKWFSLIEDVVAGRPVRCERGGKEVHAADVARAASILLRAEGIAGEAYNCCDRYISEYEVATLAREIAGSSSAIEGEPKSPKHQIVTDKLQALGMRFGGRELLEQTVQELVAAVRAR